MLMVFHTLIQNNWHSFSEKNLLVVLAHPGVISHLLVRVSKYQSMPAGQIVFFVWPIKGGIGKIGGKEQISLLLNSLGSVSISFVKNIHYHFSPIFN